MNYRAIFLATIFLCLFAKANGTTYYSVANGNWTGNIWSSVSSTSLPGGALPTLVDGDILVIDDHVDVDGQITIAARITLNLVSNSAGGSQLNFDTGKKLTFSNTQTVINLSRTNNTFPLPQINPGNGGGNSNFIEIGTVSVWESNDGQVAGTGQINSTTTNGVLPIKLISFIGQADQDGIFLNWKTALEKNFHYFSLERSGDGKNFVEIAQIKGSGNSNVQRNYSYSDASPISGKSYYRLRSVDFDNYQETFDIVAVNYSAPKSARVFPNPVIGNKLNLELNYVPKSNVAVVITNLTGKVKATFEFIDQTYPFDLQLDPGTYLVKVSSDGLNQVVRVVIVGQ